MLTTAGFDTDTAVGGLTAFSLLEVGGLRRTGKTVDSAFPENQPA
jgi:hypothetical protein